MEKADDWADLELRNLKRKVFKRAVSIRDQ